MSDLAARLEVRKLARDLAADPAELDFLAAGDEESLRDLRALVGDAVRARHADLVNRLASLSRLLPAPVTAKMAQQALGPVLSARVACALEPQEAARLVSHLDGAFVGEVAAHLEPRQVPPIVAAMRADLVVDAGRHLLAASDHVALARLVAAVSPDVALRVVADAEPAQLLQVLLLADDPAALEAVVARLDDRRIAEVLAAGDAEERGTVAERLARLSEPVRARISAALAETARD